MKNKIITALIQKGVCVIQPETVLVSDDVNPDRISPENVTIYPGCRISGEKTLILSGSTIGYEAPVTIHNALIGKNTTLNGGFFKECAFAGDNTFGSGAHVRQGTILEEQANAAHTVGLKQTILFPFVTLGSLINFCDCLMAGGTSRKNHSEVGSSFIHFNYTPNQDKATASMLGNVHQGVLLNKNPIFLGGQGGIAGPVRLAFGSTTAAGSIIRKDQLKEDMLILGGGFKDLSIPKKPNVYFNVQTIFNNNIYYISGLVSLMAWYRNARPLFANDGLADLLVKGMEEILEDCINERLKRLSDFSQKLVHSKQIIETRSKDKSRTAFSQHTDAIKSFPVAQQAIQNELENKSLGKEGEKTLLALEKGIKQKGNQYVDVVQSLSSEHQSSAQRWLFEIENRICEQTLI